MYLEMMWCRGHAWEEKKEQKKTGRDRKKHKTLVICRMMQRIELWNTSFASRIYFTVEDSEVYRGYVTFSR